MSDKDQSYTVCGHTAVKHVDDTWTIFKNGVELESLGSGYTLEDIKKAYCD